MKQEKLTKEIINLIEKAATEMPADIVLALKKASQKESKKTRAQNILLQILKNIEQAKNGVKPICQDTGTPIFYVKYPQGYSQIELTNIINKATAIATRDIPLRQNSVDSLTGETKGNIPIIHFENCKNRAMPCSYELKIDLLFKGGGSENVSAIYALPNIDLKANRDLDGVRKCILDAVVQAQGKGCPPYIIGVAIGGNIEQVAYLSKKQLLRKLGDKNKNSKLNKFENQLVKEINQLKIGPLGLAGKTTALGVKVASDLRHPASFFVGISFGCWALRRKCLNIKL